MTDETFKKLFLECRFNDLDESITKPDFRLSISGVDCVARGSIVAVAGKPGVGKSTAMAVIAGILIGGLDFGKMQCKIGSKRILWIDTEKDPFSCKQRMRTLREIARLDKNTSLQDCGIDFFCIRHIGASDRLSFVSEAAKMEKYDAIFIDGIFDLTNDPDKDYIPVIDLLKSLADTGATIFAMLHTNKQAEDDNMRYALGTELQRICTNRFSIKYDKSRHCHNIIHDKSNDTQLAPIVSFRCDENGIAMPFVEAKTEDNTPTTKKDSRTQANEEKIKSILDGGIMMSRSELIQKLGEDGIKNETAVKAIQTAKKNGVIDREEGKYGKYYLNVV